MTMMLCKALEVLQRFIKFINRRLVCVDVFEAANTLGVGPP